MAWEMWEPRQPELCVRGGTRQDFGFNRAAMTLLPPACKVKMLRNGDLLAFVPDATGAYSPRAFYFGHSCCRAWGFKPGQRWSVALYDGNDLPPGTLLCTPLPEGTVTP